MLADDVLFLSAAQLSQRIRSFALSPVDLTEAYLSRIERVAPRLNCFVTVTAELARAEARKAEREIAQGHWRGPLHGLPYGLKDLLDTKGIRTTFGAKPFADRVPDRDATVVRRLREAGAVLLGKLSMIEMAGGLGYTWPDAALNGACRNPWDTSRWSGGSSSGPGAAVAAGLCAFAIGSETVGSIESPSAACGVTGLRPTYGAVSRQGAMALSYTLDKLGPLCRAAQDCALVLSVIAGRDPKDPTSVDAPKDLRKVRPAAALPARIAVIDLEEKLAVDPQIRAAFAAAQQTLRDAGAKLERTELPDLPYSAVLSVIFAGEALSSMEGLIKSGRTKELGDRAHQKKGPDDYDELHASAHDYVKASRVRLQIQRELARFFTRYDFALTIARPFVAPLVDREMKPAVPGWKAVQLRAGNVAGLPALTLPMGFVGPGKLPVAMSLMGRPLEEARLLSLGALFQTRTSFHRERPPI